MQILIKNDKVNTLEFDFCIISEYQILSCSGAILGRCFYLKSAIKMASYIHFRAPPRNVKVGFFQKVLAKFSNFSNCHSCESKIVPELLVPVRDHPF